MQNIKEKLIKAAKEFFKPTILLLCLAGSIRNAGKNSKNFSK